MSVGLPSGRRDVRLVVATVGRVLSDPRYAAVAIVATLATLTVVSLSRDPRLVTDLLVGGSLPLSNRVTILTQQYPFVGPTFTTGAGVAAIAVSALAGVDLSLFGYHLREHELSASGSGASAVGVALGVLGAGCAACGSALLVGLLSLVGASGLLALLPLHGLEVSLLAIGALALSTYWLAEGMHGGTVEGCPIDR